MSLPANAMSLPTLEILGCRIHSVSMDQTVDLVRRWLREGGCHQIVTADSSALVIAQTDPEFHQILETAALVVPDSIGVVWASGVVGKRVPDRVCGVDLMARLCELAAETGRTAYFLGAAPGVAQEAAAKLEQRYSGLKVVGTRHGFFGPEEEEAIVGEIRAVRPDLLMVALGIPKQEKLIARWLDKLEVPVCVGVGGSLDCYSGRVKRAPAIYQRYHVEWLYRLISNPRKASKVMMLPRFMWMVLKRHRLARPA